MRRLLLSLSMVAYLLAQEKSGGKPGLPLKTDHKLEFDTDEGTWLSLDISKDGKTILFDLLGDLYTIPYGGGDATPVITGLAFDSQAVYSPDGSMIAFVSDRSGSENLWVAKANGSEPKQLSKDKQGEFVSPSWTPDGEYVLVSRNPEGLGTHEIWMYDVKGGAGVQVTKSKPTPTTTRQQQLNFLGAVASPDGKFFYYARRTGGFTYNATFPLWQIVRRDRTTGDEDVITDAPGSAFRPVLSPDGKKMVYGTRYETETGLRIRDLSTGEDRWLKYPIQRDDQESRATRDVLPELRVHAGWQRSDRLLWRQDQSHPGVDRREPAHPVSRPCVARDGAATQIRLTHRRRAGARTPHPGTRAFSRRKTAGILGVDSRLHDGPAQRQAGPYRHRQHPRV